MINEREPIYQAGFLIDSTLTHLQAFKKSSLRLVGLLIQPLRFQTDPIEGSMSSSEMRMNPRPPKAPAWSHGLLTSGIDDPSSSDNASDNSDKLDSFCSTQIQAPPSSNGVGGGNNGCKSRKRKIIGNSGPSFVNSGNCNDGGGGGRVHGDNGSSGHQQNQKDGSDIRSSQASLWTDAELAADFDGSLSGLGADLSTSSYDMSEALLALPNLYQHGRNNSANGVGNTGGSQQQQGSVSMATGFLKEAGLTPLAASHLHGGSSVSLPGDFHFDGNSSPPASGNSNALPGHGVSGQEGVHLDCERRFQYVLAAATSVATKVNEETLTYLNQGQPYEIKLKKLGELTAYRGVVFRTIVRLCFHDRRLQFSEREQLTLWEDAHPNDRILQVDLPLSYGITLLPAPSDGPTNTISFLWEPLKEVGLYAKVNCISTEFTPKKHGGEKGVPFRLMIETYSHPDNVRLHAGACQIKVFKLKGADRKHKQDREKIMKKTPGEQAKLQPSYDCTVFSDISLESLDSPVPAIQNTAGHHHGMLSPSYSSDHPAADSPENNSNSGNSSGNAGNPGVPNGTTFPAPILTPNNTNSACFSAHFSPESVRRWLVKNRFASSKSLWDFSGVDLLRLSKEELVEICGLPEGIRLHNALHYKITFYLSLMNGQYKQEEKAEDGCVFNSQGCNVAGACRETTTSGEIIYHPICLSAPSISEMTSVIASLFSTQFPCDNVTVDRILLTVNAPGNASRIRVHLTEQLLSTLKDQTAFKAVKYAGEVFLEIVE